MSDIILKTNVPHSDTASVLAPLYKYEPYDMQPHLPVIWDKADGYTVTDIFGNKYLDFTSTIFVANTGHRSIETDLIKQAKKCIHSYTFPTKIRIEAITKLHEFLPKFCEKIYLASAGSEVTSWAIRLMRARDKKRQTIISLEGAFHGKTGLAGELEEQEIKLHPPHEASDVDNTIKFLDEHIDKCCGIMIESYQGWTARFLPAEYVQKLVAYCRSKGLTICFDEIQAGLWRTGKKFAYEWYEVTPDLICIGKALGGGFPVSALAGKESLFKSGLGMSSTHSATPLACASIVSVLNSFEKMDMHDYYVKSQTFLSMLNLIKSMFDEAITEVNVRGLVASVIFKDRELADIISRKLLEKGLLVVNTGKEAIKLGPPLIIPHESLKEGLRIFREVLSESKECLKS